MSKGKKLLYSGLGLIFLAVLLYFSSGHLLTSIGSFLVADEEPVPADAVVILNSGVELYPRIIEAARIYEKGLAKKVVLNGNRKTDIIRGLEDMGFEPCCPWYEDRVRILSLLGVPKEKIIVVSAEDAYDTITEAKAVGTFLKNAQISNIIITTSKYHTRRAGKIWRGIYPGQFKIQMAAAHDDPFSPQNWWTEGRQVKWVLAEYGAWLYFYWKEKIRIFR